MTRARADGRLCLTTTGPCCGLAPAALRRSLIVFCDFGPWALPMMSDFSREWCSASHELVRLRREIAKLLRLAKVCVMDPAHHKR
ncbi:unnamed protein product [Pelagomonas calceolata]|uniref:Uncharacterized protein n=1 Tax=Pelagomonas calceolata TaxID=35677 RepID=A0A8J2WJL7_9STRA|nr:unnamed protein product [Pelagomonas calceolata]